MTYAFALRSPLALDVSLAGGKAVNLAKLTKAGLEAGFNVPSGWVVSSYAHDEVLKPVRGYIKKIEALGSDDHDALARAYTGLAAALLKAPLSRGFLGDLDDFLNRAKGPVAVRSSATCEDSGSAAFAGQHDTFLNVCGRSNIITAIKRCFASFYAPQAVIYRRQVGASAREAKMAVVVQKMANCDKAGVAFSLQPVTGALDQTMINANFGLGESVVSGESGVDQFVYDRSRKKIIERHVAETRAIISAGWSGGTVQSMEEDGGTACLSDHEIEEIAELSEKVACFMNYPQDIEWGYVGAELVLLQSRPVTKLPERLTRDESAERFPNAVTPMTWGLVEAGFHRSLAKSFDLMGLPAFDGRWFVEQDFYIYGNQTAVELYHQLAAASNSAFDFTPEGLEALALKLARIGCFARDWQVNLERFIAEISVLGGRDLSELSLQDRWNHVEDVNEACARFFEPNIAISLFHTGLSKALEGAAALLVGEVDAPALINDLKSGLNTRTAHVNRELRKLAGLVKGDEALRSTLKIPQGAGQTAEAMIEAGTFQDYPDFKRSFAAFVHDFGHREVDFDPYHAPWGDDPEVLLAQIIALAETDCELVTGETRAASHASGRACAFTARQRLLAAAPGEAALVLSELIDLVRTFEELDDLEHYSTSRVTRPIRRALLGVGEKLADEGVLQVTTDIWMLTPDTLRGALTSAVPSIWQEVAGEALEAKARYLAATSTMPQWEPGLADVPDSLDDTCLAGLPGSAGQVEGEVFILESTADFKNFPRGAVLVARTTNPAWTPLFYAAAAVITESGGPLSHGAVTAREVGIPAVMCVKYALTKLYNGLRVRVDGTSGRVDLLETA